MSILLSQPNKFKATRRPDCRRPKSWTWVGGEIPWTMGFSWVSRVKRLSRENITEVYLYFWYTVVMSDIHKLSEPCRLGMESPTSWSHCLMSHTDIQIMTREVNLPMVANILCLSKVWITSVSNAHIYTSHGVEADRIAHHQPSTEKATGSSKEHGMTHSKLCYANCHKWKRSKIPFWREGVLSNIIKWSCNIHLR